MKAVPARTAQTMMRETIETFMIPPVDQSMACFGGGMRGAPPTLRLFNSERVRRATDRAGDRQRRRREEKLVNAVLRAVHRQVGEVEVLPDRESHIGERHPVPGLAHVVDRVRAR